MDWSKAIERLTRVESLLSLVGMIVSTGAFAWVWEQILDHGWPLAVLFGFGTAAILVLVLSFLLIAIRYFRPIHPTAPHPNYDSDRDAALPGETAIPVRSEREEKALDELTEFVLNHLLPTVEALYAAQQHYLYDTPANPIFYIVLAGFRNYDAKAKSFHESYMSMSQLTNSPAADFTLDEMTGHIANLERNYSLVVAQLQELKSTFGPPRNEQAVSHWEKWRARHIEMTKAYELIKKERRFGRLFRPARPSRWGDAPPSPQLVSSERPSRS